MESNRSPSGDSGLDLGAGAPHLADYWNIISRRIWLVLLIFGVTTASAIWAVSRQGIRPSSIVLAALLGLTLGLGAALSLEYLNRTIRTSSDVEALLGIPVLGLVPHVRNEEKREKDDEGNVPLIVALDPLDPAAEAYRHLRMNLSFMSTDDEPVRTILVTSPGPSEGKSTTAVSLAVMLAQPGKRILLIDADLRGGRPSIGPWTSFESPVSRTSWWETPTRRRPSARTSYPTWTSCPPGPLRPIRPSCWTPAP